MLDSVKEVTPGSTLTSTKPFELSIRDCQWSTFVSPLPDSLPQYGGGTGWGLNKSLPVVPKPNKPNPYVRISVSILRSQELEFNAGIQLSVQVNMAPERFGLFA